MSTNPNLRLIRGIDDPVARWSEVKVQFPEAGFSFDEGWYIGFLRHHDPVVREPSLDALIKTLLAREQPEPPDMIA